MESVFMPVMLDENADVKRQKEKTTKKQGIESALCTAYTRISTIALFKREIKSVD